MLKRRNITGVCGFSSICQLICYSAIEEAAHVIGKSQSMMEEVGELGYGGMEGWKTKPQ